jgi:hypothetical protein
MRDLIGVRTVRAYRQGSTPLRFDVRYDGLGSGLMGDKADRNVVTLRGSQPRGRGTNAAAASGDQDQRYLWDIIHQANLMAGRRR